MRKPLFQIHWILCSVAALGIGAVVALGFGTSAGCGGCPWLSRSSVTVTPATPCLDVHIADGSGNAPSTGCVDPVLVGNNNCTETLHLPANLSTSGQGLEVAPGNPFAFEIELDKADHSGDRFAFAFPANLGSATVTISFHVDH